MLVNPFWFGVVTVLAAEFILAVISTAIRGRREEEDEADEKEDYRKALEELTGKKFRIVERNGFLVGEPVEEENDEKS